MSDYLLLRSNKQTGPYSLEDLQTMELKAYDLIWIEGKSAAWRYPSEIEELKPYAKVVEEQPYDRFFKRPSAETQQSRSISQYAPAEKDSRDPISRAAAHAHAVYINFPAERRETENGAGQVAEKNQAAAQVEIPAAREVRSVSAASSSVAVRDPDPALEEKYSQPLDEIKKQYLERVINRKPAPRRKPFVAKPVALGLIMAALLAGGIFIGLTINKRGNNSTQKDLARELAVSDQPTDDRTRTIPVYSPANQPEKHGDNALGTQPENLSGNGQKDDGITVKKKPKLSKLKPADIVVHSLAAGTAADSQALASHPVEAKKTDAQIAKDAVKSNIANYISVTGSNYNVGTFGGITGLQITVSNRSVYPIDLVVVEVQYVQSNKKTFKTENLYFHDLGAGSARMEEAPKSPRGIKVQYKITLINSKELGLSYTTL